MIVVLFNNDDKKIEYIGRLIKYKCLSIGEGFYSTEWEDLLGKPGESYLKHYTDHAPVLMSPFYSTQKDRVWIKDIFEHLIVGETWDWK